MITSIRYGTHEGKNGRLSVINPIDIPFTPKRIFWIDRVPQGMWRGGHAHKECHQALFALRGIITVSGNNGTYLLEDKVGVYVPPMTWTDICFRSQVGMLLVLASHDFYESDYIRDYTDYLNTIQQPQAGS